MAYGLSTMRLRFGPHIGLLLEIVCVSAAVIGLLGWSHHAGGRLALWVVPWVLTLGALVPTLARGRSMRELGFRLRPVRQSLLWLGLSSVGLACLGAVGMGLLDRLSIKPPLCGAVPRGQWFSWLLFQFGLVALPEEIFFRGYFLTNCTKLLQIVVKKSPWVLEWAAVGLAAGVFAVAHVLVLGGAASVLTFFPGLVFGWLFVRSGSLLPPALLHGTANIGYVLVFGAVR